MGLSVISRSGKPFVRCGMTFGADPVIVENDVLDKKHTFSGCSTDEKKLKSVREALLGETALFCTEAKEPEGETTGADGTEAGDGEGRRRRR